MRARVRVGVRNRVGPAVDEQAAPVKADLASRRGESIAREATPSGSGWRDERREERDRADGDEDEGDHS